MIYIYINMDGDLREALRLLSMAERGGRAAEEQHGLEPLQQQRDDEAEEGGGGSPLQAARRAQPNARTLADHRSS